MINISLIVGAVGVISIIAIPILSLSIPQTSWHPNPEKTSTIVKGNSTVVYLKYTPTSFQPINKTSITALVTSTQLEGNHTIIHLINGINLIDQTNKIQSGDAIYLNLTILKALCNLSLETNSKELKNNTSVMIQILIDPKCELGFTALSINEWYKLR